MPENNAWHVVCVGSGSPSEVPFIVTRNVKASEICYPQDGFWEDDAESPRIPLDKTIKPYGEGVAVWTTRGGSVLSAPAKHVTRARLCEVLQPEGGPGLRVLPAQGGAR